MSENTGDLDLFDHYFMAAIKGILSADHQKNLKPTDVSDRAFNIARQCMAKREEVVGKKTVLSGTVEGIPYSSGIAPETECPFCGSARGGPKGSHPQCRFHHLAPYGSFMTKEMAEKAVQNASSNNHD
jgi:hypothetical protein